MTVAMLVRNTFQQAVKRRLSIFSERHWSIQPLKPTILAHVGTDIEISRDQKPKPIVEVSFTIIF